MATSRINPEEVRHSRQIEQQVQGRPTSDGDGVKLTRLLEQRLQTRLDPYLLMDAFGSDDSKDYIGGFPDHPHRGFETITYMISGRMRHRDSAGNEGLLQNGGVQWMTAGKGLVHSELPEQEEGLMAGVQLWLNLPSHLKMMPPSYRDISTDEIPELRLDNGVLARVVAGYSHGLEGAVQRDITHPLYIDLHFSLAASFCQTLPASANAFVYVYQGQVRIEDITVPAGSLAILSNDAKADGVCIHSQGPARALLIAGQPLNEPIAQYGPFVMNTQDEIRQALADFRAGLFQ